MNKTSSGLNVLERTFEFRGLLRLSFRGAITIRRRESESANRRRRRERRKEGRKEKGGSQRGEQELESGFRFTKKCTYDLPFT